MVGTLEARAVQAAWTRVQLTVLAAVVLTLTMLVPQLFATDFGFDEEQRGGHRVVTFVDPGGPADRAGIVAGDELLWDPGLETYQHPWTEREVWRWVRRLGVALRSGRVPMVFAHRGEAHRVELVMQGPTFAATIRQLRRQAMLLPTAFAYLAAAIVLARGKGRDEPQRRRLACSFALFGPCFVANIPAPSWPEWLLVLSIVVINFASVTSLTLMTWFVWSFPTRSRLFERARARSIILAVGLVAATVSVLDVEEVIQFPLHGNSLQLVFNAAVALLSIVGLGWQRRNARAPLARRQSTFLLGGVIVGYLVPIVGMVIPILLGHNSLLLVWIFLPLPLHVPVAFVCAVGRYRLFDLDALAPRAGFHAMVVATSLLVYLVVASAAERALAPVGSGAVEAGRTLAILAIVAIAEPSRRFAQRAMDRLFARDRDAFLASCAALSARLASVGEVGEIERLVRESLGARVARLLEPSELPEVDLVPGRVLRVVTLENAALVDRLLVLGVDALVPVKVTAEEVRALALSVPLAAHLVDSAERDALEHVGSVIGAALAQRSARAALETRVERAVDERRRIAMELHDGLGATLTAARLMTEVARRSRDVKGTDDRLAALESTLREGLSDLRLAVWSLDPEDVDWPSLLARLRRQCADMCGAAQIAFEMTSSVEPVESPSPALRLTVLRLVQEGVTNAVRHARPTRISVQIEVLPAGLTLTIEDDGVGLAQGLEAEGHGLANMGRRVRESGGTLEFGASQWHPDARGTRVTACLPVGGSAKVHAA